MLGRLRAEIVNNGGKLGDEVYTLRSVSLHLQQASRAAEETSDLFGHSAFKEKKKKKEVSKGAAKPKLLNEAPCHPACEHARM